MKKIDHEVELIMCPMKLYLGTQLDQLCIHSCIYNTIHLQIHKPLFYVSYLNTIFCIFMMQIIKQSRDCLPLLGVLLSHDCGPGTQQPVSVLSNL